MNKLNSPPIMINGGVIPNEHCFSHIINAEKLYESASAFVKQNQINSEKIQRIFADKENMNEYKDKIFDNIIQDILDISTDKYGNYLIREILNSEEQEKVKKIFLVIKGHIRELSKDKWGTFVIQELIKNIDEEQLKEISDELIGDNDFRKNINSQNELIVFQKLIIRQGTNANNKLCEKIVNNFVDLCNNQYVSFFIETLLLNCSENYYDLMFIICRNNICELSKAKYGHFIVSFFIENKRGRDINMINMIYESLKGKIYELSQDEFATFTVQSAIVFGNQSQRNQIIDEIKSGEGNLNYLSKNGKGHFVILKMLNYLDRDTLGHLLYKLNKELHKKSNRYAKEVVGELQKFFKNSRKH